MQEKEFENIFSERFSFYKNSEKAQHWLNDNFEKVKSIFKDVSLRDFIFEPFKDVFKETDDTSEGKIKSIITLVAVVNMVLAGLPGKMLGGVAVCIALEAYNIGVRGKGFLLLIMANYLTPYLCLMPCLITNNHRLICQYHKKSNVLVK